MSKKNWFSFSFGKEKKDIFHYAKVGVILSGGMDLISWLAKTPKKAVFNLIDKTQLAMGTIEVVNDYIIKDQQMVEWRIERVINEELNRFHKKDK